MQPGEVEIHLNKDFIVPPTEIGRRQKAQTSSDKETRQIVWQKRLNALCSKNLHRREIQLYQLVSRVVTALCIAVPIIYVSTVQFPHSRYIILLNAAAAGALLSLSVFNLIYGLESRYKEHIQLMSENSLLAYEAEALLGKSNLTPEMIGAFLEISKMIEKADHEKLCSTRIGVRQKAFREALKEMDPSDTNPQCPVCESNPWMHEDSRSRRGSVDRCNACGADL